MNDHMSFLIFLKLFIKTCIPDKYLKLLYFSVPKLFKIDTFIFFFYQKTRTEPEQLFYFFENLYWNGYRRIQKVPVPGS